MKSKDLPLKDLPLEERRKKVQEIVAEHEKQKAEAKLAESSLKASNDEEHNPPVMAFATSNNSSRSDSPLDEEWVFPTADEIAGFSALSGACKGGSSSDH